MAIRIHPDGSDSPAGPPKGIPKELGDRLRDERIRQGLSRLEVTLAIRHSEDRIRWCESGYRPAWDTLQPYLDFLAQNAEPGWLEETERILDEPTDGRLEGLSPAGRVYAKAVMLRASRDSSVGRAAVRPTSWAQLDLGLRSPRRLLA